MANAVAILGDSGTLSVFGTPFGAAPDIEFRSGSFRPSVDERRVIGVFMFIPTGNKQFELRFEFTDHSFDQQDLFGKPTHKTPTSIVWPYTEPRVERNPAEGR